MKRNKRTETLGHEDLTPLTELILAQMGDEGTEIRRRLISFYRRQSRHDLPGVPKHLDRTAQNPRVGRKLRIF
jgi:hypothetical protein